LPSSPKIAYGGSERVAQLGRIEIGHCYGGHNLVAEFFNLGRRDAQLFRGLQLTTKSAANLQRQSEIRRRNYIRAAASAWQFVDIKDTYRLIGFLATDPGA
jgi:hypothetical protein